MRHVVNLQYELELIYNNAANSLNLSVDEMLEIVLSEYVNTIAQKMALN